MSSILDYVNDVHDENKKELLDRLDVDDPSIVDAMLSECNEDLDLATARLMEMGYEGFSIKRREVAIPSIPPSGFLEQIVRTTRAKTSGIDPAAFLCMEVSESGKSVVIQAVNTRQVEVAGDLLAQHIARMSLAAAGAVVAAPPAAPRAFRHIFVDNSNLYIGRPHKRLRINVPKLTELLTKGGVPGLRIMVGSDDDPRGGRWVAKWEGYRVQIAARQGPEAMVDEFLHAQMYNCCFTNRVDAHVTTIVLVTGDGNRNGGRSNFPAVVEHLKPLGYRFEVWAWRASLSQRLRDACDECCLLDDVARVIFA
jgi:hypothetical protein